MPLLSGVAMEAGRVTHGRSAVLISILVLISLITDGVDV